MYACMDYASGYVSCIMFKLLISALMSVHVLGAVCPDVLVFGRVLFTGRRVGDVTAWYQSSCCSMGLHGPPGCSDRGRISFCPAEISNYDRKLC